jgi:hypothetical protein
MKSNLDFCSGPEYVALSPWHHLAARVGPTGVTSGECEALVEEAP